MKLKKSIWSIILALILFSSCLISCSDKKENPQKTLNSSEKYTFQSFTGTKEKQINVKAGDTILIYYDSKIQSGNLNIKVVCPYGIEIVLGTNTKDTKELKIKYSGDYEIVVTGEHAKGYYSISYKQK